MARAARIGEPSRSTTRARQLSRTVEEVAAPAGAAPIEEGVDVGGDQLARRHRAGEVADAQVLGGEAAGLVDAEQIRDGRATVGGVLAPEGDAVGAEAVATAGEAAAAHAHVERCQATEVVVGAVAGGAVGVAGAEDGPHAVAPLGQAVGQRGEAGGPEVDGPQATERVEAVHQRRGARARALARALADPGGPPPSVEVVLVVDVEAGAIRPGSTRRPRESKRRWVSTVGGVRPEKPGSGAWARRPTVTRPASSYSHWRAASSCGSAAPGVYTSSRRRPATSYESTARVPATSVRARRRVVPGSYSRRVDRPRGN